MVWNIFYFSISYMGCHPSHWLSLHHFPSSFWTGPWDPSPTKIRPLWCSSDHAPKHRLPGFLRPGALPPAARPGLYGAGAAVHVRRGVGTNELFEVEDLCKIRRFCGKPIEKIGKTCRNVIWMWKRTYPQICWEMMNDHLDMSYVCLHWFTYLGKTKVFHSQKW